MKRILVLNGFAHAGAAADFAAAGWDVKEARARPDPIPNDADDAAMADILRTTNAIYVSLPGHVNRELIARAPQLRVISVAGAGYQNVDIAAATEAGVAVINQSGVGHVPVAEHMVAMLLALSRRLVTTHNRLVAEGWASRGAYFKSVSSSFGTILAGKTAGIVGLGNIGARVARTLSRGFDMRVVAFSPATPQAVFDELGVMRAGDVDTLCGQSDFVLVVTNYTPQKHHMVGAAQIAAMKPHAMLINAGRGPLIDQAALYAALKEGKIAGAGLDVFEPEPPPDDDPIFKLENVLVTPHVAGLSDEAQRALAQSALSQCNQVMAGERPPRLVNPDVWDRRRV